MSAGALLAAAMSRLGQAPPLRDELALANLVERLGSARSRGYLTTEEFLEIGVHKSRQRVHFLRLNTAAEIKCVTRLAFSDEVTDEVVRIRLLSSLHGVRLPRASAILAWVFPERWPVIDRRAWTTLNHLRLVDTAKVLPRFASKSTMVLDAPQWSRYVDIVLDAAKRLSLRPLDVDRWLYACDLPENKGFL